MVENTIFWVFAVLAVVAALGAVLNRSIINAALCLVAVFLSMAGFFILNNADFLALAQVIVYAVGLTIVMLFAIMFTGDKPMAESASARRSRVIYGVILLYVLGLLVPAAFLWARVPSEGGLAPLAPILVSEGSTAMLGAQLFRNFALPFELASVLLLAAMIGAIVIAKKRFAVDERETLGTVRLPVDTASAPPEEAIAALRAKRLGSQSEERRLNPKSEIGDLPDTSPATVNKPSTDDLGVK